jgi:hypothetical protein
VVLITLLIYSTILIIFLSRHNYDPGALIHPGSKFTENTYVDPNLPVSSEYGYDGQFYYRLALEPFYKNTLLGPKIDAPAYRMQRILYPVFVHLLSFGRPGLVPFNLIFVNLLFICLIAFAGAEIAKAFGLSPIYGLAFSLYPGFVFSLIVDTPEALTCGFILLSLLAIRKGWHILATLFLSCMLLTRETTFIVWTSIFVTLIIQYFKKSSDYKLRLESVIIPFTIFSLWQGIIYHRWGHPAFAEGSNNLGIPFFGYFNSIINLIKSSENLSGILDLSLLGGYLALWISGFILLTRSKTLLHEKVLFLLYSLFVIFFSQPVYEYRGGFLRVFSEFYTAGIIIILSSKSSLKQFLVPFWLVLFFLTAWGYSFIH